ncbi:MAG: hypothetical protein U5L45_18745 [Saprospiraceae bacterium]|nr:hypothetical protein [Saprospiraceae bacterium]
MAKLKIDFDGNWKEIIIEFFEEFVDFFLPELYPDVDFSRPFESLDTELTEILQALGSTDKRIADKLVKVWLKDGREKWILIHIEVQSYFEQLFAKRMFEMFAFIFKKHQHPIVAIAIYTGIKTPRFFNQFTEQYYGTSITYRFNAYRIMKQDEMELLASDNIFSLFVLANIYANNTRKNLRKRLAYKEQMMELAIEHGISHEKMHRFFLFIEGIMKIPLDLQEEFRNHIRTTYKIEKDMSSVLNQSAKPWADIFTEIIYGDTTENMLKKEREVAQKEREVAQKEREVAQKEREKVVVKMYTEVEWSATKIADILDMPIKDVKKIIAKYKKDLPPSV